MSNKKRNIKVQALTEMGLMLVLLILANLIFSVFFYRIDLTKEKRYSLSDASKILAGKLDDVLYVKVYLRGEFPAGFKRLSQSTREMLDEFAAYAGGNLQYEFVDPFAEGDTKKQGDVVKELVSKGLQPTNVQIKKDDEMAQKIIVPGALFYYKGKEFPVNFLKGQFGAAPEEVINSSIELIEYEIANLLRKVTETSRKSIAFLDDHGELGRWDVADAQAELEQYYEVKRIPLSSVPPLELNKYVGVVIAKPTQPFSDFDKFKLDQYVMNGGKILWLLETQVADMDSLQKAPMFVSSSYDLNLDDILFRYGIRVNPNIVQDIQCEMIPILSSVKSGTPQQKLLPWLFFPVASPASDHPVVKNIDPVWFQFAASIDTTSNKDIRKSVLLRSSPYARLMGAPVRVDLNMARVRPDPDEFSRGSFPMAVLLEGKFKSIFQYRLGATNDPDLPFKESIEHNKMIVVSDGDVIRNQRKMSTGEIFPLGYNRFTNQQYGNKRFILNCLDYLCDESGILEIRGKEITLRLLNKAKIKKEKLKWQLINTLLPLVLVVVFGIVNQAIRRRKYTR
ncbi:MAG: gliding motility-associated ABC transporter substrate-binding protein GldG [Bacteroidia bacterium]|jgi:ABC-2 type transport system permease protein